MLEQIEKLADIPGFSEMISDDEIKVTAGEMKVLQVNLGKLCNLACKHCHVEAGPDRTEVMSRKVMEACLKVYKKHGFSAIDITGGAPEMNPDFEWFLNEACKICSHVIVRTNLVVLLEKKYSHLMKLYVEKEVELVCSLPYYQADRVDRVRGTGTFDKAIEVIRKLNKMGYGEDSHLILNMVYNPAGAFFPPDQGAMEQEYKKKLSASYGITFNQLFTIMNNPTGRFLTFLIKSGNLVCYMQKLYDAFNPATLPGMMCRFQLSVRYDGKVYDCDFNQAADYPLLTEETIFDLSEKEYMPREIFFGNHCYACTAGQGSSCGGATEK